MSEPTFKDFCLDYESDHDKKPNVFEAWQEMQHQLSASQAREAELREKLAAQQAIQTKIANFLQNDNGIDNLRDLAQAMLDCFESGKEELRKQLEESKVPEGWQLVPKVATSTMIQVGRAQFYHTPENHWRAMLAAAPQPQKEK